MEQLTFILIFVSAAAIVAAGDWLSRKRQENTHEALLLRVRGLGGRYDCRYVYDERGGRLMRRGTETD